MLSSSGACQFRVTEPSAFTTAVRFAGAAGGSWDSSSATAAVAALVRDSWLPASSVKLTRTRTALPASVSARV